MGRIAGRLSATFHDRDLWATRVAGVSWTILAVLGAVVTIELIAIPYGFFDLPFTAIFALLAVYFACSIWVRRSFLVAIAAFATSFVLAGLWFVLWFVAGMFPMFLIPLVPAIFSIVAAGQIRKRDRAAAQMDGG